MKEDCEEYFFFTYFFSDPLTSTLSVLTIEESAALWKEIEQHFLKFLGASLSHPQPSTTYLFHKLWDYVGFLLEKKDPFLQNAVLAEKEKVWGRLEEGVLLHWTPVENKNFHACLTVSLKEVQKENFLFFFLFFFSFLFSFCFSFFSLFIFSDRLQKSF